MVVEEETTAAAIAGVVVVENDEMAVVVLLVLVVLPPLLTGHPKLVAPNDPPPLLPNVKLPGLLTADTVVPLVVASVKVAPADLFSPKLNPARDVPPLGFVVVKVVLVLLLLLPPPAPNIELEFSPDAGTFVVSFVAGCLPKMNVIGFVGEDVDENVKGVAAAAVAAAGLP